MQTRPRNEPASPNEHAADRDRDPLLAFHRAARFSSSSLPLSLSPSRSSRTEA